MKCVMCNLVLSNGSTIHGIKRNYKVCKKCLKKHTPKIQIPYLNYSAREKERYDTIQRIKYLQSKIDKKLNEYFLEDR